MPSTIPITDFRKNIFGYASKIVDSGQEVEIERNGQKILRVIPIKDDAAERAKYVMRNLLPKLAGTWKEDSKARIVQNKKEISYNKRIRKPWSK